MKIEQRLAGNWELVRYHRYRNGAFDKETMGANPSGRIIYSSAGYMSAFLLSAGWARGEKLEHNWADFLSYSARWEMQDDATVLHHVDMSSAVEFIGTRFVRFLSWNEDGLLTLKTDGHTNRKGERVHDELTWRRTAAERRFD
jgi:hypothetical protein